MRKILTRGLLVALATFGLSACAGGYGHHSSAPPTIGLTSGEKAAIEDTEEWVTSVSGAQERQIERGARVTVTEGGIRSTVESQSGARFCEGYEKDRCPRFRAPDHRTVRRSYGSDHHHHGYSRPKVIIRQHWRGGVQAGHEWKWR